MRSSSVVIGDIGLATQYNDLRKDAFAAAHLLAHEQATPDLTLKVESGVCFIGTTKVVFAGGNSPSFTAPTTNPRIDLLTIDNAGVLARVVGTEAASPSIPAYPTDKVVLCEVFNRVGQTTIRDTDVAGQGYIQRDTRPFLGGTFISSDSQVDVAAAIQISKIRRNSHVTPETDNTYDLGSSALQWREVRAVKVFKNNAEIGGKFGGTGADGALTISSGTTTLDLGGVNIFIKNYSSISITGTGQLAFNNPAASGTLVILKSLGDVTITSTATPAIDCRNLGGALGNGGGTNTSGSDGSDVAASLALKAAAFGKGIGGGSGGSGGAGGAGGSSETGDIKNLYLDSADKLHRRFWFMTVGAGGAGGGGGQTAGAGGNGGRGGGGLYIECGGALNKTGTIDCGGAAGANATAGGTGSGGGGGGGGGSCIILANSITANTGAITVSGGGGGALTTGSGGGTGGGGGGGGGGHTNGSGGQAGALNTGGNGGSGSSGFSLVAVNNVFA